MSDKDKPYDFLREAGPCPGGGVHMVGSKDGVPVMTHMHHLEDGQPVPSGHTVYYVDPDTGRVVDTFHNGPAQVSTPKYREGWDAIFGGKAN